MVKTDIDLNGLKLKNPVLTASGTFGYGEEYIPYMDLSSIGGIIVKGTTLEARQGNPYPRMAETPSGMLNAVGLQNKGVKYFIDNIYKNIKDYDTNVIVNLSGSTVEDYAEAAAMLSELDKIPAIELNISCPNIKGGGMTFGTSVKGAASVISAVRKEYKKHLMVKLTPNVTDITEIAKCAEQEGADSVSLINTLLGMAVDADKMAPKLSTITGGLSGACVKPIALRCVWQVYNSIKIPIVGLGGIMNAQDAVEFMLAGASAIEVGTANFIDPSISEKIASGIIKYCEDKKIHNVSDLTGALKI